MLSPGFQARKVSPCSQPVCHLGSIKWNGYCLRALDIGRGYCSSWYERATPEFSLITEAAPQVCSEDAVVGSKNVYSVGWMPFPQGDRGQPSGGLRQIPKFHRFRPEPCL